MSGALDTVCIVLAGGRGRRMASSDRHKVCFPIAGRPAIVRGLDAYRAAGLERFVVVVGQMAEQVMATVCEHHPGALFVYQPDARGTGHAARCAVEALAASGFDGHVLVTMGDKVTRPEVVRRLLARYAEARPDVLLTALPKDPHTTSGRIVRDAAGTVLGVVETADLERAQAAGNRVHLAGRELDPARLEAEADSVNVSLYVFRFAALRRALQALRSGHADGELYLPDTVEAMARDGRVDVLRLTDPTDLMGYNTPAELLAVEEEVRRREKGRKPRVTVREAPRLTAREYRPVRDWLQVLSVGDGDVRTALVRHYGADPGLIARQRGEWVRLLERAAERLGPERPVVLCRAPGRVNLMGRHIDHRGGHVNVMATSREVLLAAAVRTDDTVTLHNLDTARFPDRAFTLFDLLGEASWSDWMDFLASSTVQRVLKAAPGDWSHYARAPLLRLQYESREVRLHGMDCVVSGNIPMGAGLSSSSALVVAFAEAAVALNGLSVELRDFIDLCGEGEWFVGSRGGSADHAAIRTSKVGVVSRIGFFPFRLEGQFDFPAGLEVVIAHSGSQAVKSAGARDVFNQRVACYQVAERLLRRYWPPAAGMEHLRDLGPERLGVRPADLYRALARLPERPSRRRLRALLPEPDQQEALTRIFGGHANLGGYDLRGVTLFGLAECQRSAGFADALKAGDLAAIGRLMRASHDGDRICQTGPDGRPARFRVRTDDASLERLAAADADLRAQPGRYACSTPAIDQLVDLALGTPGVVGAQLAGAGLGGCMMIVLETAARDRLLERLRTGFYEPRGLALNVYLCRPVAGAGLLSL